MEITQANGKSYAKHPTSENLDTWIGRRGIHPLLATSGDMYSAGSMPASTTKPPPCTQHLLQPRNAQPHSTRSTCTLSPVTMQDATLLSSCHFNANTTGPGMMSRSLKDTGMQSEDRSKFEVSYETHKIVDLKRRWTPAGSDTALWVRVKQDVQMVPNLRSPGLRAKNVNSSFRNAQSKQYSTSMLSQETFQTESSGKQWSNIEGGVKQVRSDLVGERHNIAGVSSAGEATPAFMHDQNESASPSDHAMSEDHTSSVERRQAGSPDAELKRMGSMSSEEFVDVGRSLLRKNSSSPAVSKNLASERKRRKKLNDGLYSLRAMVPKISKMDKASIVGDAIDHVKDLQQKIQAIETEIAEMESTSKCSAVPVDKDNSGSDATATIVVPTEVVEASAKPVTLCDNTVTLCDNTVTVASTADVTSPESQEGQSPGSDQKKILKMDVAKLEGQTYQLQISCQRAPGVLVQLTQALESLDLHVLNAYHTSFQGRILNTFIVEMINLDSGEPEDVRISLLDAVAEHGFVS